MTCTAMGERNSWQVPFTYIRVKNKKMTHRDGLRLAAKGYSLPISRPSIQPWWSIRSPIFFYRQTVHVYVYYWMVNGFHGIEITMCVCYMAKTDRKSPITSIGNGYCSLQFYRNNRQFGSYKYVILLLIIVSVNYVSFEKCLYGSTAKLQYYSIVYSMRVKKQIFFH